MNRGVLIFVSPETVVESIRPRVRVIQADGIKNFIKGNMFNINPSKLAELRKVAENLSDEDKQNLFNMLSHLSPPKK